MTMGTVTLESYKYLGLATVVERDEGDGVNLTYIAGSAGGDSNDVYTGLDRFGRVVDQKWTTSGGTVKDEYVYTYDADGNVLSKVNTQHTAFDETYAYDGLNRLTNTNSSTSADTQAFSLDNLGNMTSVTTNGTTENRTTNSQNQLTVIRRASTLTYDDKWEYDDGTIKGIPWCMTCVEPAGGGVQRQHLHCRLHL